MDRAARRLGWTLALAGSAWAAPGEAKKVDLEPRAYRTWELWLPGAKTIDVGSGFAVPHQGGERFAVQSEGSRLRADLDGNGAFEALVEGNSGFLTLNGTTPEGRALNYSVRLSQRPGQPWQYTCGGAMVGEIAGTRIQIVDQNLNGSFCDFGEDALAIGRDGAASFLSKVVSIDGALYTLDVARDGTSLEYAPYEGASGVLDLATSFESKAKLQAAVVVSSDGKTSFSLARAKDGLRVPAGDYLLHSGSLVLGDAKADIKGSRDKPFHVDANGTCKVAWGGPVRAEFAYEREGDQLEFTPWDIWYFGQLGEQYSNFLPLGKTPDFYVSDRKSGEQLVIARFPGNC